MGGIVKIGNYMYGCGTVKPMLLSINANTGIISDSLRIGSGAVIAADNMLYYYTNKGDMNLLSIDEGRMTKISTFRIKEGPCSILPIPSSIRVFCTSDTVTYCWGLI